MLGLQLELGLGSGFRYIVTCTITCALKNSEGAVHWVVFNVHKCSKQYMHFGIAISIRVTIIKSLLPAVLRANLLRL